MVYGRAITFVKLSTCDPTTSRSWDPSSPGGRWVTASLMIASSRRLRLSPDEPRAACVPLISLEDRHETPPPPPPQECALPPLALPPFVLPPLALPPLAIPPFALPLLALPPFALRPFALPPFAFTPLGVLPTSFVLVGFARCCHPLHPPPLPLPLPPSAAAPGA